MSIWPQMRNDAVQSLQDFLKKKPPTRIDPCTKMNIISALDNGHNRIEIARQYGVHPQTIAYIYKNKDRVIKKCTKDMGSLKDVKMDIDPILIEWMKEADKSGNRVTEKMLKEKTQDIFNTTNERADGLKQFLSGFQKRHNVVKHAVMKDYSKLFKKEWNKLFDEYKAENVYVGMTCSIFHKYHLNNFLDSAMPDNPVSVLFVTNCTGTIKQELLVKGTDCLDNDIKVTSLPLDYHYDNNCLISYSLIHDYLQKWQSELAPVSERIALILDVPEKFIENIDLENITIFHADSLDFMKNAFDKLITCFKFQYRKLQIRKFCGFEESDSSLLSYLHLLSLAWHCVPGTFIHKEFNPPMEGYLHLHYDELECEENISLTEWATNCGLNIDQDLLPKLDDFVQCDQLIPSMCHTIDENNDHVTGSLLSHEFISSSAVDALQAMKRLTMFLQSESARGPAMSSAQSLEDQLENDMLLEIQKLISNDSTNVSE